MMRVLLITASLIVIFAGIKAIDEMNVISILPQYTCNIEQP